MIDKKKLTDFILTARTKTYAGNVGEVKPLLAGSKQFEFSDSDWLYRDVYNQGNGKFVGLETVYYQNKPIWSMSYYGNFEKMSEEGADAVLRKALIDNWDKVRLGNNVTYEMDDGFVYENAGSGNIDEVEGSEEITQNGKVMYYFYYAGALIG